MNFTKMQSAGNDYVLVEATNGKCDWSSLAINVCNRHFGIGADSLLLLMPSEHADFRMRIFDMDGSEAEACGNGIRCLARYAFDQGLTRPGSDLISVETAAGVRQVRLLQNEGKLTGIQANMGPPRFSAAEIPVVAEETFASTGPMLSCDVEVEDMKLRLDLISMGNPHAVFFWDRPVATFPLDRIGPRVERLPIFPNRVNFEVARVLGKDRLEARVWERGVGETLACGSGACAICVAANLHGYTGEKVDITLPGDVLKVEWHGDDVLLSGPAERVFTGRWPD